MFSPSKTTSSTTHMPLISFPSERGSYGTTSSSNMQPVSYFKEQKSENFEDLPKDVLCKIMQFIDSKEMGSLLSTCSRMLQRFTPKSLICSNFTARTTGQSQ